MLPDHLTNDAYLFHSGHKNDFRERRHLGIAESTDEILDILEKMRPKVYAILASCLDGSPTLRLANDKKTWRVGLKKFSRAEIFKILNLIDKAGVQFNAGKQLRIDRNTLREPVSTKIFRKILRPTFDTFLKFTQIVGNPDKKWSSAA